MASSARTCWKWIHWVDLRDACRVVGPDIALWGNLDPVGLLAQSTPAAVAEAARQVWRLCAPAATGASC